MKYRGYSYPRIFCNKPMLAIWKRTMCKWFKWHLWDEVMTAGLMFPNNNTMVCDACEEEIAILDTVSDDR